MTTDGSLDIAKQIFDLALELPVQERIAYISATCSGNPALREKVERLLANFESASEPLRPIFKIKSEISDSRTPESLGKDDRFSIRQRLGRGAFGTVYEAFDAKRNTTVALKLLNRYRPELLLRFKHEFRSLLHIRHPNLVQLFELFAYDETWFFTMELVRGQSFLEFIRPQSGGYDESRLRSALSQLVNGVHVLHQQNCLHRDLKPANVLVDENGRVVILDFGLLKHLEQDSENQSMSLVGTPAYMSPEQALGQHLTPASDWFSVGIMLFQAVTGVFPRARTTIESPPTSSTQYVLRLNALDSGGPQDLHDLCSHLLEFDHKRRPTFPAISAAMGAGSLAPVSNFAPKEPRHAVSGDVFVGRAEQLNALRRAFGESQAGQLRLFLIEGASGIGKTELVNHFIRDLKKDEPALCLLRGKCYEFESVPYKGLDVLIDRLSEFLGNQSEARIEALLPRDAFLLPRLFPVLGRIGAISSAPSRGSIIPDEQELRQRTFTALRELFARIADRHPMVVWIDDLQWSDRDSMLFIAELCAPPFPPPMLLILTYRTEELIPDSTLQYLGRMIQAGDQAVGSWRHIALSGLSRDESSDFVQKLVKNVSEELAIKIAINAQGHPLFIQELARSADSAKHLPTADASRVDLQSFLARRIDQLPSGSREFLELVSVAAQPVRMEALFAASSVQEAGDPLECLSLLVRENLARTSGDSSDKRIEPFHDQVRLAVLLSLSQTVLKARHGQLAKGLSSRPDMEPQALVVHYKEAGDLGPALKCAISAAEIAERQLAFDRAAIFYQEALSLMADDDSARSELSVKLASCLAKAGRGKDAADAYLKAADLPGSNSFELRRLSADQLIRSGYIDSGMHIFAGLAKTIGIPVPKSAKAAFTRMLWGRLWARAQLLRGIPRSTEKTVSPNKLVKLGLLRTGATILNVADPVGAAFFQVKYISDSLRIKEPTHLTLSLGLEASLRVAAGTQNPARALAILGEAERIATDSGDKNTIGTVYLCRTYFDYLMGWIAAGIRDGQKAVEYLRQNCTGVAWELATGHVLLFWFLCWAGDVQTVRDSLPQLLREGANRGDVNIEVSLRLLSYVHYYYLADDRPEECLAECDRALEKWSSESSGGFYLQHYGATFSYVESYLYMGEYARAREYLMNVWGPIKRSYLLRWQILTIMIQFLRGRVALACWLTDRGSSTLRREIKYYAERLMHIGSASWGAPMARVLMAGLCMGEDRRHDGVRLLEDAAYEFEKISLHAYASAARFRCGSIRQDDRGSGQILAAQDFLNSQHVRNPEAFLRMLLPGAWS